MKVSDRDQNINKKVRIGYFDEFLIGDILTLLACMWSSLFNCCVSAGDKVADAEY